jgi:hypothetical protein
MAIIRKIKLTQNKYAIVDKEDYKWLMEWKWHAIHRITVRKVVGPTEVWYAGRTGMLMHRQILGLRNGDGILTDHVNHDGLDNRRKNLRKATAIQNAHNRNISEYNRTGYKGVYRAEVYGPRNINPRWGARISVNGKLFYSKYFDTKEEAALAYNELAIKYHGEFARLNVIC